LIGATRRITAAETSLGLPESSFIGRIDDPAKSKLTLFLIKPRKPR